LNELIVSQEDIKRAVKKLEVLRGGYRIKQVSIGVAYFVIKGLSSRRG